MAGSFCPEQNHTAKPNCMLSVYHFDDSGHDRTNIKCVYTTIQEFGVGKILFWKKLYFTLVRLHSFFFQLLTSVYQYLKYFF